MDMYVKINDAHNLLRPEFIESLFYMWYFTGNKTFQDWGWQIFQVSDRRSSPNMLAPLCCAFNNVCFNGTIVRPSRITRKWRRVTLASVT